MDREQMEQYLQTVYNDGYNSGISALSKELAERVDRGIRNTPGIGEKRYAELISNINKELTKEQNKEE